ncbi:hypothetical protein B0H14DRAFT_2371177, partial [Mycena olivaceomarginata]
MLTLSLPTHIFDRFRIHCADSLDAWVISNPSRSDITAVSEVIVEKLCSASAAEELRLLPVAKRDPQLENTILSNHDMLLLLLFTTSIKSGDVSMVLNILAHWMVMFRGTGSMPKYAYALFEVINNLEKKWLPAPRDAYLNNWVVNLMGIINSFKEIDLLQEHQNFWAKVGYQQHVSPHHGIFHTSPNAAEDIAQLQGWLKSNKLQTYVKERPGKDSILRVRDLM